MLHICLYAYMHPKEHACAHTQNNWDEIHVRWVSHHASVYDHIMFAVFSTVHSQNTFPHVRLQLSVPGKLWADNARDVVRERFFGENHLQICLDLTAAILPLTTMIALGCLWLVSNSSFLHGFPAHSKQTETLKWWYSSLRDSGARNIPVFLIFAWGNVGAFWLG